jgi:hypothetical protein
MTRNRREQQQNILQRLAEKTADQLAKLAKQVPMRFSPQETLERAHHTPAALRPARLGRIRKLSGNRAMTCTRCLTEGKTFHLTAPSVVLCPKCLQAVLKAERARVGRNTRALLFRARKRQGLRVNPAKEGHNSLRVTPFRGTSTITQAPETP